MLCGALGVGGVFVWDRFLRDDGASSAGTDEPEPATGTAKVADPPRAAPDAAVKVAAAAPDAAAKVAAVPVDAGAEIVPPAPAVDAAVAQVRANDTAEGPPLEVFDLDFGAQQDAVP